MTDFGPILYLTGDGPYFVTDFGAKRYNICILAIGALVLIFLIWPEGLRWAMLKISFILHIFQNFIKNLKIFPSCFFDLDFCLDLS